MDSPVRVLVRLGVNVGFSAWKFDCRKVRGLLLRLNMHTARQKALDRRTITESSDSGGEVPNSERPVSEGFHTGKFITKQRKDLSNPCTMLLFRLRLPFTSLQLRLLH